MKPTPVIFFIGFAFLSLNLAAAEGPIAAVQDSLRKKQYFTGKSTGVMDLETRAALKRFQIHESLPETGELDTATLERLQSNGDTPSAAEALNKFDPSVRGRAQELVQSDKEFLQKMEVNEPVPPADAPQPNVPTPPTAPPPRPPKAPREPKPAPEEPPKAPVLENQGRQFVERYLEAAQQPTPERENAFYAEEVSYFDSGKVGRKFIERDQQNYYRRWPSRQFTLLGEPEVTPISPTEMTVRFSLRYAVQNAGETGKGETENFFRIKRGEAGWKIVSIHERKVRR